MKNKKGLVFSIQPFSIHDGKGIRTSVFLKGCPLRCLWCHNPEGLKPCVDLEYFENKCVHCGRCNHAYQKLTSLSNEQKIKATKKCPYHALHIVGKWMSVQEVLDEVLIDSIFYEESGGGLTLSGGEPMLQADFAYDLLKEAKKQGLQTTLETSGYAPIQEYQKILPYIDCFYWDYKESDSKKHKQFTGVGNQQILSNFEYIYEQGASIVLRCPIIPTINDTEEHFKGIANMIKKHPNLDGWELMPYHRFGLSKEKRLGMEIKDGFVVPTKEQVQLWNKQIQQQL